ncbi:hypothetical protein QT381_05190 [Galbitalea sp. SE-J8]|uniref:hypothetical protein n=1 Tax=Galbitalea sp. SE-J8 TaxID=3054952 RepID=UPI00259CAA6F|nr:hypothetical protein [Galbitalea sp. SE-J8]MDM4762399.1 hypothetical protein [Galbitalea sp. SE-J8]
MTDSTGTINLTDRRGRFLLVLYGSGTTLVALVNLQRLEVPALGFGSLVLVWVALTFLGRASDDGFGIRSTVAVLVLVTGITLGMAWNITDVAAPGYANWHLGAITFMMFVLAARGRVAFSWLGFGIMAALSILSTVSTGQAIGAAIGDLARQAGTLVIGTVFALSLRRAARTIRTIQGRQVDRIASEAAVAAAERERSSQSARLERYARPALERIADGAPLTASERRSMALLEAELRDGIRAAGFNTPAIVNAVRSARERTVHVALVDDRGAPLADEDLERVEDALLHELRRAGGGRVTARLSSADSDEIATIVVAEGDAYRSVIVRRTGIEVTRLSSD